MSESATNALQEREAAPSQLVSGNRQEFNRPHQIDVQNNSVANSMFDQSNTQTYVASTSDPSALKQATLEQPDRNVHAEVTHQEQAPEPVVQNFGNVSAVSPPPKDDVELSKGKRGSETTQLTGTVGNASTTQRSAKFGAANTGKSSFAAKSKGQN